MRGATAELSLTRACANFIVDGAHNKYFRARIPRLPGIVSGVATLLPLCARAAMWVQAEYTEAPERV